MFCAVPDDSVAVMGSVSKSDDSLKSANNFIYFLLVGGEPMHHCARSLPVAR
jgi:hypothetical protein